MKRRTVWVLAGIGVLVGIVQPHRLWCSADPVLDREASGRLLGSLSCPASPSIDERLGELATDRVYALRGYRHVRAPMERGETLGHILASAGVSPPESAAFCEALRPVFDPRRARDGDPYEVLVGPEGRIRQFRYEVNPAEVYEARLSGDAWTVERLDIPVERRREAVSGRLAGSLYASIVAAGADADLVMSFIELFRWDVDFAKEAQEDDEFRVVYERLYAQGRPFGNGRILAASYRDSEEEHVALYYKSRRADGYYDLKGQNLKKSFLKSPLKFSHISSGFSLARRHPILDVVRPHRGVDYAAPAGTPVRSVADGRIEEAGWKGGAGINVTIGHALGYESFYNHLASLPKGMRRGRVVRQGDLIGYVGSTGLSTGPHLDFRIRRAGAWVNPLKEKFLASDPVPAAEAQAYREWARAWQDRLDAIAPPAAVVARR
ncbi:MAG: peptidoglycan DD-metalloendopeptidase family protein [Deltaproteobacteria bacterium]|nr:peptidoglycan DD-metalloendopeptidase family protein [Deltaproteobacteria bacterium]